METIRQHFVRRRNAQNIAIVTALLGWIAFNLWDPYRWDLLHRDSAKLGLGVILVALVLLTRETRCPRCGAKVVLGQYWDLLGKSCRGCGVSFDEPWP